MSNPIKVGVVGYVSEKHDRVEAWKLVEKGFESVRKNFPDSAIEVVSMLVDKGVPQCAYYQAAQKGWPTSAVAPEAALKSKIWPCDTAKRAGEKWGDEVDTFLSNINVLIAVGRNNHIKDYVTGARKRGLTVHESKLDVE
jgi:hypothetical protein